MPRSSGSARRTSMSPDAYQPLSTAERNEQLSCFGAVSVQSPFAGSSMTWPFVVSYHWYRRPSERLREATSRRVARASDTARRALTSRRSFAATTDHRYTPMFAADVYWPRVEPGPMLSSGRCVTESMSEA